MAFSDQKNQAQCSGFTLVELLAVMAIAGILLVAVASGLSTTGSGERRAAAAKVSAILTAARAEAIAQGEPVGVIFLPEGNLPADLQSQAGGGLAIFSFEYDDGQNRFTALRQLDGWQYLENRVIFSNARLPDGEKLNAFAATARVAVSEQLRSDPRASFVGEAPAIVFSGRGRVLFPERNQASDMVLGLWEGEYGVAGLRRTRQLPEGLPHFEEVVINYISGRSQVKRP